MKWSILLGCCCLAFAFLPPGSASELEFVGGFFTYDEKFGSSFGVDHVFSSTTTPKLEHHQKTKFPLVSSSGNDGELLLFLAIHQGDYRFYAYRVHDLEGKASGTVQPLHSFPGAWPGSELFGSSQEELLAFLRGGGFLERSHGKTTLRASADPSRILNDQADSIREWLGPKEYVDSQGLIVDGKPFFSCSEVFSVDESEGVYAVGYQDKDRIPQVCLLEARTQKPCACGTAPFNSQPRFDPRFSNGGSFLATTVRNQDTWELQIHALNRSQGRWKAELMHSSPDINFYDITTESFMYLGSYTWFEQQLFFVNKLRLRDFESPQSEAAARTLNRLRCDAGRCSQEALALPGCVRLEKPGEVNQELVWMKADALGCGSEPSRPPLDIDIKEVIWVQPFLGKEAQLYVAAEAVVKPRPRKGEKGESRKRKWLSRILIFKLR